MKTELNKRGVLVIVPEDRDAVKTEHVIRRIINGTKVQSDQPIVQPFEDYACGSAIRARVVGRSAGRVRCG